MNFTHTEIPTESLPGELQAWLELLFAHPAEYIINGLNIETLEDADCPEEGKDLVIRMHVEAFEFFDAIQEWPEAYLLRSARCNINEGLAVFQCLFTEGEGETDE